MMFCSDEVSNEINKSKKQNIKFLKMFIIELLELLKEDIMINIEIKNENVKNQLNLRNLKYQRYLRKLSIKSKETIKPKKSVIYQLPCFFQITKVKFLKAEIKGFFVFYFLKA